jgi:hypothetical protein
MSSTIVIFTALDHNVYLQSFGLGLLDRLALACDIRNDRRLGYVHLNAENGVHEPSNTTLFATMI